MLLWFLVGMQFLLAAVIVLSVDWWPVPVLTMTLASPGIGLAIAAWMAMGLRRIRIHPSTTDETRLIQSGPYAIVRHPMYTGLLWFAGAIVATHFSWERAVAWVLLVCVLWLKTHHEEIAMDAQFNDYANYQRKVGKLLPRWW